LVCQSSPLKKLPGKKIDKLRSTAAESKSSNAWRTANKAADIVEVTTVNLVQKDDNCGKFQKNQGLADRARHGD